MLERIADGRTDLVFDLVDAGQPAGTTDAQGITLLQWCAHYGDVSAMRFLLTHGETLRSLGDNFGLSGAAFHGHWRLCQFLLESGAAVQWADPVTGETPLHAALCVPNRPTVNLVVQVLLAHGADPNATTRPGAPTDAFMRDCRTKAETPLHRAAAFGDEEVVGWLIDAGAKVDAQDVNGDSPLAWASWHTRPDAILRLLCYGRFTIHAERNSTFDHGAGWRVMEKALLGRPHPSAGTTK